MGQTEDVRNLDEQAVAGTVGEKNDFLCLGVTFEKIAGIKIPSTLPRFPGIREGGPVPRHPHGSALV
jgi:hypothetical protein